MKKFFLIGVLGLVLTTTSIFANERGNWGIGVRGGYWGNWRFRDGSGSAAFLLTLPQLPIHWGLYISTTGGFDMGLTGDYYFIDNSLVNLGEVASLGWFLGLGGYLGIGAGSNRVNVGLGARLPVGICLIIPAGSIKVDLFLNLAPSLGLDISNNGLDFPGGGIGGELGVRVWF